MFQKLAAVVLTLMLAACGGADPAETPVADATPMPTGMDYVKLSRTPCFGACPVYDLTLHRDGRQVFHGSRFTKATGQHIRQTSAGRFMEAVTELEARGFMALRDDYTRDVCKLWATDHPSITIELRLGDQRKTVNWYTGCRGMEDQATLRRLVDALEEIMDVESFIGTDAERAALKQR